MNRKLLGLSALLVLQCALLFAVWRPDHDNATDRPPLAPFDLAAVDAVVVADGYDNEASLLRRGEQWLLPELGDLPADNSKVDALLAALSSGSNWPVADSSATRQRFQVADYYYQRSLTLLAEDEPLGVIYLGTSPGFRKVHARNAQQAAIYSIPFNVFDAPAVAGAWLAPDLLQVRAPVAITADSYSLRLDDGVWRSGAGGVPDEAELQALLDGLRHLQVTGVADEDVQRELAGAEAALQLHVRGLGGEVILELFRTGNGYYILSSDYPLFFTVSAYDFKRLNGIDFALISGPAVAPGG